MDAKNPFRPDRNQAFAVVAMIAAVFAFSVGEILIGFVCFGVAAVFSLGGLFWNAHRADRAEAAAANSANSANSGSDPRPGSDPLMRASGAPTPPNKEPQ